MCPKTKYNWNSYEVDKNGCWIWNHILDTDGYGRWYGKRAFKLFYEKYKGRIPNGLQLDHLCKNRLCVNPNHLEPVTQAENCRRGDAAKLTKMEVFKIRDLKGKMTYRKIASLFNISHSQVYRIIHNLRWKGI